MTRPARKPSSGPRRWPRPLAFAICALAASALPLAAQLAATPVGRTDGGPIRVLRVCADPNNLPFSNRDGHGFENRVVELLARDLGATVEYAWRQETRGFVRKGLKAGLCDVIPAVPEDFDEVETTAPWFRSTYVFVTRRSSGLEVRSLDDPRLRDLRIGIHVVGDDFNNPPPAQALAARGIVGNVTGYRIVDDYSQPNPPLELVHAVERGDVDVAIIWGPFVGPSAVRPGSDLAVTAVVPALDRSGQRFAFAMSMGVRHGDDTLRAALDRALAHEAPAIREILDQYGVPHPADRADAATPASPERTGG